MSAPRIRPVNETRQFEIHELFFSTTDPKGLISYGNGVFTRIAGYEEKELLGAPHNIIRHPDMPRAVFKLLWDYIEDGRTIAAYVKNMAKDGRYYWVLALVMPCEGGYVSVRLKPTSAILGAVEDVYREALEAEKETEAETANRKTAIEAGAAKIMERLGQLGFSNYDDFMREALSTELAARNEKLSHRRSVLTTLDDNRMFSIERDSRRICDVLDKLFSSLGLFKRLNSELTDKSSGLFDIAETLHFESLNAKIAASKLEHGAAVLGAISRELSAASRDTEELITQFIDLTRPITRLISNVIFDVAAARLETEVCEDFAGELGKHRESKHEHLLEASLRALVEEMVTRGRSVDAQLHELMDAMDGLNTVASQIMSKVAEMKSVQFAGLKEALSRRDAAGFVNIFNAVGDRIARGREDCGMLLETIDACRRQGGAFVENAPELRRLLDATQRRATCAEGSERLAAAAC